MNPLRPLLALAAAFFLCEPAPAAEAQAEGSIHRNLKYGEAAGSANLLDIYLPAVEATNELPVIIWIHGGGWELGDKNNCPAKMALAHGYAVASLNYRLSQEAVFPAQLQDCKGAIRWLRAHAATYHLKTNCFGAWGASAGGHLAALLGTTAGDKALEGTVGGNLDQSSQVQAVCDWFGPADLERLWNEAMQTGIYPEKNPLSRLLGGTLSQKADLARQASPVSHVSKTSSPFLIFHGQQDKVVPLSQSQELDQLLQKSSVPSQLIVVAGAGHGGPKFSSQSNQDKTTAFFDKYLKP